MITVTQPGIVILQLTDAFLEQLQPFMIGLATHTLAPANSSTVYIGLTNRAEALGEAARSSR
jgi:hypothetical protein